jgi:hypothetical protein
MRHFLATLSLALALGACGDRTMGPATGPATGGSSAVQPAPSDAIAKGCDDYATALQVATPLKASIPPKVVTFIDKANAVGALACVFGAAGAHYETAVAAWAAQGAS